MNFEFSEVADSIYCAKFDNRFYQTATFCRLAEYYESPSDSFRGKYFLPEDFQRWYTETHDGGYTYPEDWGGHNIPSHVIRAFLRDYPLYTLTQDELELFVCLHKALRHKDKFYLISVDVNLPSAFEHEMAHGYFYLYPSYEAKQRANLAAMPGKIYRQLQKIVLSWGYCENVVDDEIQAYLSTGLEGEMRDDQNIIRECERFISTFNEEHRKRSLT